MGNQKTKPRHAYGSGSLLVHTGADGQEVWYGRWYLGKRRPSRRIGPKRRRGTGKGLTQTEAEAGLRRMMLSERAPRPGSTLPLAAAAEQMLRHLEAIERKASTLENTARPCARTCSRASARRSSTACAKARSKPSRRTCCERAWRPVRVPM